MVESTSSFSFCVGGTFKALPAIPGLVVEGEHFSVPLTEHTATSLTSHMQVAPFGKGDQLLTDANVRDAFQIDASRVHFANPQFTAASIR